MTLEQIKKTIHEMDPTLKETDSYFQTAMVMLASFEVGQNIIKLAEFTGLPRAFVKERAAALRVNKVWKNGKTFAGWDHSETGGTEFWMDVAVAEGLLQRC